MKLRGGIIVGVVVIGAGIYALSLLYTVDDVALREMTVIRERTVPPKSVVLHESGIARNQGGADASWEFRTEFSWADYGAWTSKQLADWRRTSAAESTLEFSRYAGGDLQYLRFDNVSNDTQVQIRVTFRSQPD